MLFDGKATSVPQALTTRPLDPRPLVVAAAGGVVVVVAAAGGGVVVVVTMAG